MTKRLIDIDDELLAKAKEHLGASTNKEAVNRSLEETIRIHLGRELLEHLSTMEGLDLNDPEVMKDAWRAGKRSF